MICSLVFSAFVILILFWYIKRPLNLPPGPSGIPILGYIPWILYYSKDRLKLIKSLKKYGNIVCIRIGFSYMVFLNDMETIKEAFKIQGDHFSGRGLKILQKEITNSKGILSSEGKHQRENRRFILKELRNLGFGKMSFEEPILESVKQMFQEIATHQADHPNESLDFRKCLTEAVADNITQIVLGIKFDNQQLCFIIERMKMIESIPQIIFMINSFPLLTYLLKFQFFKRLSGIETFKQIRIPFQKMVMKYVQNHKSTFDKDNISDFLYSYINEQSKHNTKDEAYWWDDEQIMHACTELIAAGMGTTEATISWFLFLMAQDKEWQKKVTDEIDLIIGRERDPSTRDLANLPLCEASILETLRWSSLAATGIPHAASENSQLCGYFIPKDTIMIPNLLEVSRDNRVWSDPENFNPAANFLSSNQKEVINRDKIIPFSVGRRSCIGESLARMEITLFFIAIFQKYEVSLDPKIGMAKVINSLFRIPNHRNLIFRSRI